VNNRIRINRSLTIPVSELEMTYSTSSGPGGQHANKAATRVDLHWNVKSSRSLGPVQRERILMKLDNRIDSAGVLHLSSGRYRSQFRNKQDVTERFAKLIAHALRRPKTRIATGPTKSAKERRLADKRRRSDLKRRRRVTYDD
jgi:ribosome-associated protein